jgi:hypothetical protein
MEPSKTFDYPEAQKMVRDCVCSRCWDALFYSPAPDRKYYVRCVSCRHDTVGYVTKHYVDTCRAESRGDATEVKQVLKKAGVIKDDLAGKTNEDLIKDLGF